MAVNPMQTNFNVKKQFIGDWNLFAIEHLYPMLQEERLLIKRRLTPAETPNQRSGNYTQTLPVTLFPSVINRDAFNIGHRIQPTWNQLMRDISDDPEFVLTALNDNVLRGDSFTKRMVELYKTVHRNGIAEDYSLGIFRCDYMPNKENCLKVVEMNTISVSCAGLAMATRQFHRRVAIKLNLVHRPQELDMYMPVNNSCSEVAHALLKAQELYKNGPNNSCILIVIEPFLANVSDVRMIEEEVEHQSGKSVSCFRATFLELIPLISLGPNNELLFRPSDQHGHLEVSVVYYRTGYSPDDFAESSWWDVRCTIERSRAIKCPNIGFHVAGVKHFQNIFNQKPSYLKRYLDDANINALTQTFVQSYDVNEHSYNVVRTCPNNFVLKPNREGGANNIFGEEIVPKIRELIDTHLAGSYGLMEFIAQTPSHGYVVQPYIVELHQTINTFGADLNEQVQNPLELTNELGFFGVHLASARTRGRGGVLANITAGHLLRTKLASANEIGIVKGYGSMNSPLLI